MDWLSSPVRAFDAAGNETFVRYHVAPKLPIKRNHYSCGRTFNVDPIIELEATHHTAVGVVLITGDRSEVWTQTHTQLKRLRELTVHRLKHQKAGGQSAPRFQRTRLNQIDAYVADAAEEIAAALPASLVPDVVVAGNGDCLDKVLAELDPGLRSRVRQVIRLDVVDIHRAVARISIKAGEADADAGASALLDALDTGDACIVYGKERVRTCLAASMVAACVVSTEALKVELLAALAATTKGAPGGAGRGGKPAAAGGAGTAALSGASSEGSEAVDIRVSRNPRIAAMGGVLARTFFPAGEALDALMADHEAGAGVDQAEDAFTAIAGKCKGKDKGDTTSTAVIGGGGAKAAPHRHAACDAVAADVTEDWATVAFADTTGAEVSQPARDAPALTTVSLAVVTSNADSADWEDLAAAFGRLPVTVAAPKPPSPQGGTRVASDPIDMPAASMPAIGSPTTCSTGSTGGTGLALGRRSRLNASAAPFIPSFGGAQPHAGADSSC